MATQKPAEPRKPDTIEWSVNDQGHLVCKIHDGDNLIDTIILNPADFAAPVREGALLNGFKQAAGDAAALGKGATPQEKSAAIRAKIDRWHESGEWKSGGGGEVSDGLLIRALMDPEAAKFYGGEVMTREEAQTVVRGLSKSEQAQYRASPELAPIIDRLRAERVKDAPKVDVGAALARLRGMGQPAPQVQ